MPERPDSYDRHPWYKVYSRESLEGSLRFELNSEERGVWWDFCHMANESRVRGVIQANDQTPYPLPWLAAKLNIPLELLERCIKMFIDQERISVNDLGIEVLNFGYWQGLDTRRRGRPAKLSRSRPESTEEQKLNSEYRNALAVAQMDFKKKNKRKPTDEEIEKLVDKTAAKIYGQRRT